ncbi:hypothetical protein ACIRU3_38305 [Streptomyces sp. NPDC101151]|uniref:hypothetical protein n=1 Tax=Streptomyces sp. NPDC101151 TaxID=3366115 RepID=UPI003808854B
MVELWAVMGDIAVSVSTPIDPRVGYRRLRDTGAQPLFCLSSVPVPAQARLVHSDVAEESFCTVHTAPYLIELRCSTDRLGHDGTALLQVVQMILERLLQRSGAASLVAACVRLPSGCGALLLGGRGAGKTSTAIALCETAGGRLVANDMCVVGLYEGQPVAVAGSRELCIRHEAAVRNFPWLLPRLPIARPSGWSGKIPIRPEDVGLSTTREPTPVTGAYVLRIDASVPLHTMEADPRRMRYELYENTARIVRGSATPLLRGDGHGFAACLPSLDDEVCHKSRAGLVETLVTTVGLVEVTGPAGDAAQWIAADAASRVVRP